MSIQNSLRTGWNIFMLSDAVYKYFDTFVDVTRQLRLWQCIPHGVKYVPLFLVDTDSTSALALPATVWGIYLCEPLLKMIKWMSVDDAGNRPNFDNGTKKLAIAAKLEWNNENFCECRTGSADISYVNIVSWIHWETAEVWVIATVKDVVSAKRG